MKWINKRSLEALILAATALGANSAWAQTAATSTGTGVGLGMGMGMGMGMGYGMGMGMGMGMGTFRYAPSPTDYLNQRSNQNSRRATTGPGGSMGNSPNAYYNRLRDESSPSHYDTPVRRSSAQRRQTTDLAHRQTGTDGAKAASKSRQVHPLTDFFDASQKVTWPAESPGEAGLKDRRDGFEQASLAVLRETRENGAASAETVASARQKLLEYGRPALQELRASATPQAADGFHHFLLSLYDSLGHSAATTDGSHAAVPKP